MSYNGAGLFVINSSGQPVVVGTIISESVFNALTADLAAGLSMCVLKDGTQVIAAAQSFFAGTVAAPGIYFGTDTATGLYRIGLNNDGFAIGGVKLLDLGAALVGIVGALTVSTNATVSGSVRSDTYSNAANNANIIYRSGTTTHVGGEVLLITDAGLSTFSGNVRATALHPAVRTVTTTATATAADGVLICTMAPGVSYTVTLPAANAAGAGYSCNLVIVMSSTGYTGEILSIARAGSDTINLGTAAFEVQSPRSTVHCHSDGASKWYLNYEILS